MLRLSWEDIKEKGLIDRVLKSNKDLIIPNDVVVMEKEKNNNENNKKNIIKNSNTSSENHPQKKLLKAIKERFSGAVVEENYKKGVPNRKFEIDIAFIDLMIAVEIDGFRSHGISKAGFKRDREKDRLLQYNGWIVYRFSAGEINKDINKVVEEIGLLVNKRTLTPHYYMGVPFDATKTN